MSVIFKKVRRILNRPLYFGSVVLMLFAFVNPVQARDLLFRANNDVLYSDDCAPSTSGSATPNTPGTPGTSTGTFTGGGDCGEQGYGSGARNSQANKDMIWKYFKDKGMSDTEVAGMMGNMQTESAFMPDAVNSLNCKGIVQWCFDRADSMVAKAAEQNKDWRCLQFQLDYIWYEMNDTAEKQVREPLSKAATPEEAAMIFARIYERPGESEYATRDTNGRAIFDEYGGTPGGGSTSNPSTTQAGGTSSSSSDCLDAAEGTAESSPKGSLADGECSALVERIKQLKAEGKLILMNEAPEMEDIENCGNVVACPSTDHVGIEKRTAQVLISLAEQSGQVVKVYALNKDHFCDAGEHGKGLGIDIPYNAGTVEGNAIYKYLYDNAGSLGVHKLIYHPPPQGYDCMYAGAPAGCREVYADALSAHQDHIHVSLYP